MSHEYSDPTREENPYALPNIEVFQVAEDYQPETEDGELEPGWYWWSCLPGCLPDSEPTGPFDSEQEALEDARDCE